MARKTKTIGCYLSMSEYQDFMVFLKNTDFTQTFLSSFFLSKVLNDSNLLSECIVKSRGTFSSNVPFRVNIRLDYFQFVNLKEIVEFNRMSLARFSRVAINMCMEMGVVV